MLWAESVSLIETYLLNNGRRDHALAIDGGFNGMPLYEAPLELLPADPRAPVDVRTGPRIGISKAADVPWRFGEAGSRYLSRPFRSR
ncbi:DNA-3-methyladenine glycosylase [Sphingomonas sp. NCPPB 2930]